MLGEFIGLIVHKFSLYTAPKDHLLGSAARAEICAGPAEISILFKQKRKTETITRLLLPLSFIVLILICFRRHGNSREKYETSSFLKNHYVINLQKFLER